MGNCYSRTSDHQTEESRIEDLWATPPTESPFVRFDGTITRRQRHHLKKVLRDQCTGTSVHQITAIRGEQFICSHINGVETSTFYSTLDERLPYHLVSYSRSLKSNEKNLLELTLLLFQNRRHHKF